ncbi:hypothetical protein B0H21DRAFT_820677 [Amylocystis lapponica]|nr:hypothetical protein B0H21DRAFT_820677 [Amylocystis lapponica]
MVQSTPSPTKPSSPPPAYTELPLEHPQPSSQLAHNDSPLISGPSAAAAPIHSGYGPTPIAQQVQLLPYYDPRSSYALAEAEARTRWRFVGAVLWALLIILLGGFITGWEAHQRIHHPRFGGWMKVVLGGTEGWSERLASSIAARRPPPFPSTVASHHSDEEYINRSLLDSLNAQADAEPVSSSSDSEAAGATFGSLSTGSSINSPTAPYHMTMQQQSSRSDSPVNNTFPNHYKSAPLSTEPYNVGTQNANTLSVYNSMNNIHLAPPDYASLSSTTEPDALNYQSKLNGFAPAPFRTSTSFNPFSSRPRHPTSSFRDISSSYNASPYPPADIYQNAISHVPTSPSQQAPSTYSYEPMHHPGRAHDYANGGQQASGGLTNNGTSQGKQLPYGMDPYRQGLDSALLQPQQMGQQGSNTQGMMQGVQPSQMPLHQHQQGPQQPFQSSYVNGMSHSLHHPSLQSQAQYGPQLSSNGSGSGPAGAGQGSLTGASGMNHMNGSAQNTQQQEEISTIFVVGFPEDMQEREFQNMFTFSAGFEAATLKIPNKEFTAYGTTGAPTGSNARLPYPGSNDPYNLVTVNQGGVVVDGGRDGQTTSWPAPTSMQPNEEGQFVPSNLPVQPPRKQIIGFAKFRTRQEAIEARDILQGRRVDIERGSVLKAEMAKKNLHTKRGPGVGPLGLPLNSLMNGGAGTAPSETMANLPSLNSITGIGATNGVGGAEALAQRDKELGALGAMGIAGLGQRRERLMDGREDEDRDRRRPDAGAVGPMNLGALGTRGARERAEEDERERERKRKEKEAARLRQNSFAFEAFHSVPQQMVRQGANSLLSVENGTLSNGNNLPSPPAVHSIPSHSEGFTNGATVGPWGSLRDVSASAALRKKSAIISTLPQRPVSPAQLSPPATLDASSGPQSASSQNGQATSGNRSAPFSPQSNTSSLPGHPSLPSRPRPYSPSSESQSQRGACAHGPNGSSSMPASSASSISGSQSGHDEELSHSAAVLSVNTAQGTTSPQLPSPASGASSGTGRNPGDQNPPINTLYVGNLPSSAAPGGLPLNYLEDRLRELFSKRPGYRKLCFRQKSNGPMCFVEFEDVSFATKALNELYGNTLNGLVKGGGIRLSYSKNPLGVRTPTSGGNGSGLQQQQQTITSGQPFINDAFLPRQGDVDTGRVLRRDGMTSPTSSYHYTTSPPPPRFISPPPSAAFAASLASSTAFPRANPQGFGIAAGGTSSFSPFGMSPSHSTIPDQPSADASNVHLSYNLSPTTANIEASRVG